MINKFVKEDREKNVVGDTPTVCIKSSSWSRHLREVGQPPGLGFVYEIAPSNIYML